MMRILPLGVLVGLATLGEGAPLAAQSARLPLDSIALESLAAFRAGDGGWRVVGEAGADLRRPLRLATEAGTGVLVNTAPPGRGANLFTGWEHGDLDLDLEFMMPKGSNSGIYLQGRYEVQLLDSWGVADPTFADAGGIYQRWDESRPEGARGYEGHPPRVNASRAPGLWQRLRIVFKAPRFDAQGKKIANARFVRVEHNGVVIHDHLEVTGPTRAAAYADERPTGPLMLQGDHGPVAFRNVRFKRYTGDRVRLTDLRYRAYEGEFGGTREVTAGAPVREGPAEGVSTALAGVQDKYGLAFDGTLHAPRAGRYLFELHLDWIDDDPHFTGKNVGGGTLKIGGREVLLHAGRQPGAAAEVELPAGEHPFSLVFHKNRPWTNRTSAMLFVEGPQIERHALHVERAPAATPPSAIVVEPDGEPTVLRSFVRHGETKRTHAVSVGDPSGVHYSFDLGRGALLYAWRGPFVETTPMWHSRGNDQVSEALGSRLALSGEPSLALLADPNGAWPDSSGAYAFEGYALDEAGRPTFRYRLGAVAVADRIRPAENGATLRRDLRLRAPDGTTGLFARLAEGASIERLADGSYAVGDRTYYVAPGRGSPRPLIRQQDDRQELLVPIRFRGGEASLSYEIVW